MSTNDIVRPDVAGQCLRLLTHLRTGQGITPLDSWLKLGIYRLSARIYDLKKLGFAIEKSMVECRSQFGDVCRVAEYKMTERTEK